MSFVSLFRDNYHKVSLIYYPISHCLLDNNVFNMWMYSFICLGNEQGLCLCHLEQLGSLNPRVQKLCCMPMGCSCSPSLFFSLLAKATSTKIIINQANHGIKYVNMCTTVLFLLKFEYDPFKI